MRPLILITNDDGVNAKGIHVLTEVAREFGDVIVMAPQTNASGLSHSIVSSRPIRAQEISSEEGLTICSCDGTPVDCVKLAVEHFCPRRPDLVLSGIHHGRVSVLHQDKGPHIVMIVVFPVMPSLGSQVVPPAVGDQNL